MNYSWSNMRINNIRITMARYESTLAFTRSAQELRYTVDGLTWQAATSFLTGEKENVVMGKNFFIGFTAPDNHSTSLISPFFPSQTSFCTTISPFPETVAARTISSTTASFPAAAFATIWAT